MISKFTNPTVKTWQECQHKTVRFENMNRRHDTKTLSFSGVVGV
jgi:hypothetical protein